MKTKIFDQGRIHTDPENPRRCKCCFSVLIYVQYKQKCICIYTYIRTLAHTCFLFSFEKEKNNKNNNYNILINEDLGPTYQRKIKTNREQVLHIGKKPRDVNGFELPSGKSIVLAAMLLIRRQHFHKRIGKQAERREVAALAGKELPHCLSSDALRVGP